MTTIAKAETVKKERRTVPVKRYGVLAEFLWYVDREKTKLTNTEAFAVYERNRAYIDETRMDNGERRFFRKLKRVHGGGVI